MEMIALISARLSLSERISFGKSPVAAKPPKIVLSKWAFIRFSRSLVRSLARPLYLPALSLVLALIFARSQPPLLPRYLVQLFRRLKGPWYADTLFVTRESRRGCLRQASRQGKAGRQASRRDSVGAARRGAAFPPRPGNCERRGALTVP